MTLTASQSNQLTQDQIQRNLDTDVRNEVTLAERAIRERIRNEFFTLQYNANIIGNPIDDPADDSILSDKQIAFRDHFTDDGYKVGISPTTGFWTLDWANVGTEITTVVYSVRTTVAPGAISQMTIDAIDNFFATLALRATSRTVLVDTDPSSGGDIPESDFGAANSVFYEYLSVVQQQDDADNSAGLKAHIRASGLGYVDDTRITGVGGASLTTTPTNTIDIGNGTTTVTVTVGGTGTASDLVNSINVNPNLQAISISASINGPDVLIVNELAGILQATNNVGDVLGDIFSLTSPQTGVVTDNTEVYKFA